jgi:hypothetical protein
VDEDKVSPRVEEAEEGEKVSLHVEEKVIVAVQEVLIVDEAEEGEEKVSLHVEEVEGEELNSGLAKHL